MTIDAKYIAARDLQEVFRDKDTGLPLAAGVLRFFQDDARTTPKEVFRISGSPPNYSYVTFGSVITLSAAGTIVDPSGNQVTLYYYPYNAAGDVERYYVTCESAGGVAQWTRPAWPPGVDAGSETSSDYENYVSNGQFKIHNNLPKTPTFDAGEVRAAETEIAAGGWRFIRSTISGPKDLITFERIGSSGTAFANDPRYAVRVRCNEPEAGQSRKDLVLRFRDVNKFASLTDQYTFGFEAIDNDGGTLDVELVLRKYYGAGGDSPTETTLTTFTINSAYNFYDHAFIFGLNDGKIVGTEDDDFIEICLRFPLDSQYDASASNFVLTFGNVSVVGFPVETEAETQAVANVGWLPVPDYDGYNIGLPLMQGKAGLYFDDGFVGSFIYTAALTAAFGELPCNGSKYEYEDYSSDGIPYRRLADKWWLDSIGTYIFGTGADYMTAQANTETDSVFIACNTKGAVSAASDGTTATGFTFTNTSGGSDFEIEAVWQGEGFIKVTTDNIFQPRVVPIFLSAGDSDYSVESSSLGYFNKPGNIKAGEGAKTEYLFELTATNTASAYFEFQYKDSNWYYPWVTIDGTGTDPAPTASGVTYTGIKVPLLAADTLAQRAQKMTAIMNGKKTTNIVCVAAASIPAGSFFNIDTTGGAFYVWFEKAGAGTDPALSGRIAIKVTLDGSETIAEVTTAIAKAINRKYFSTPDFRGYIIRVLDNGAGRNGDVDRRFSSINPLISGDQIGTFEDSANKVHYHDLAQSLYQVNEGDPEIINRRVSATTFETGSDEQAYLNLAVEPNPGGFRTFPKNIALRAYYDSEHYRGIPESRPINAALNIFVKY